MNSFTTFEKMLTNAGVEGIPSYSKLSIVGEKHRFGKNSKYQIEFTGESWHFYDWSKEIPDIHYPPQSNNYGDNKQLSEKEELQEKVSLEASEIWNSLSQTGHSAYLEKKGLKENSQIKFGSDPNGNFIATILTDENGKIFTLQKIYDDGSKRFHKGGKKSGSYTSFGNSDSKLIYICEGVATGLSIFEAKPESMVIIAYDCHNLRLVASVIAKKYHDRRIIIAGDNDFQKSVNIGKEKAEEAARESGLEFALPEFKDKQRKASDFNDLHDQEGIESVIKWLDSANYNDLETIQFSALNHPEIKLNIEEVLGKNALTSFSIEVAKSTETPVEYAVISALACVASCLQNKVAVKITNDWLEPLVIHSIILGKSGDGKSPVFSHVIKPLIEWESKKIPEYDSDLEEIQEHNNEIELEIKDLLNRKRKSKPSKDKSKNSKQKLVVKSDEQIVQEIQELRKKKKPEPASPQIIVQDITPEQIAKKLKKQGGKIAIFDHEGGFFNTMAGRYSNGIPNLDILLKGYNGSELVIDRADRSFRIPAAYVSTCIFMQPGIFKSTKNLQQLMDSGLLSRAIYVNPKSLVGSRKFNHHKICGKTKKSYYSLIERAADLKKEIIFGLSDGARQLFRDFQIEIEVKRKIGGDYDGDSSIGGWAEKVKGNAIRIAGIIQFIEDSNIKIISENAMLRAINFARILIEHASSVLNYIGCDVKTINAIKLLDYLTTREISKFGASDLWRDKRRDTSFISKEDFDKALFVLEERNLIIEIPENKENRSSGRPPSKRYRLNSKIKNNAS